jgi:hypothetical protein
MKFILGLLACVVSLFTMTIPAHAEVVSLAIGNIIFSALYTVGVPGAIANIVANTAFPLLVTSASNGPPAIAKEISGHERS